MPSSHKAVAATGLGRIDEVEVPTIAPGPGEVLIKVEFSSLVAFDTYETDLGLYVERYPYILGLNASGTIAAVGEDVRGLVVGDRVSSPPTSFD